MYALPSTTSASPVTDFNRLYRCYAPVISAELRRFRLPVQVSEDIGQEVALILWSNLHKAADFRSLTAWTRIVTRRQAINKLRSIGREIPTEAEILDVLTEQPTLHDEGDHEARTSQRANLVQEQLADDCDNARGRVAKLYYGQQQAVAEIAAALGMPVNTVLSHLRRFRVLVQKRNTTYEH